MAKLEQEKVERDRSYAPSSGRETEVKQHDQSTHAGVESDEVMQLPGTGGPDDTGDVMPDPDNIRMPRRTEPR